MSKEGIKINWVEKYFQDSGVSKDNMSKEGIKINWVEKYFQDSGVSKDNMSKEGIRSNWNKNSVIEFENDRIALVQRKWGNQVEFIEAFDYLTYNGFKLMANESYSSKWLGRNITYFYFQKISRVD